MLKNNLSFSSSKILSRCLPLTISALPGISSVPIRHKFSPVGGVGIKPCYVDLERFMKLPLPKDKVMAEYIWIGGSGQDLRGKTKTLSKSVTTVEELPEWNSDGSSTGQATTDDSELVLRPCSIFKDPFRPTEDNILVLCDAYNSKGEPISTNTRVEAAKILEKCDSHNPTFAFEQEYSIFRDRTHLGWPKDGYPAPQGPYYCSVGFNNAFGRDLAEAHYRACLYAGINVSGINAEVMPGQWEFQVGPVKGIAAADQLWMARYLLHRVAECFGLTVDLDPKPMDGEWNGAGCHTNFCIKSFHEEDGKGWKSIMKAIKKLENRHVHMIDTYGKGNERRLSGRHETSNIDSFSYGVANRGASIRIPRHTEIKQRGYIEDRRPASNMDPYIVSSKIMEAIFHD